MESIEESLQFRALKPRVLKKEEVKIERVSSEVISKINNRLILLSEFEDAGSELSKEKAASLYTG